MWYVWDGQKWETYNTVCVQYACLGLCLEHCVQTMQCLSEKWPCVCLSDCIFFSAICMPLCLHHSQHVYCIVYIQLCPLGVYVCGCMCAHLSLAWGSSSCVKVSRSKCLNSQKRKKRRSKGEEWGESGGKRGEEGVRGMNGGNGGGQFQLQVAGEKSNSCARNAVTTFPRRRCSLYRWTTCAASSTQSSYQPLDL